MKPERILLPLDVRKCPLEIFSFVEGFSRRPEVTLILLHVVDLSSAASGNAMNEALAFDAHGYLQRLAQQFVHPITSTVVQVRFGKAGEQILEEATARNIELIVLPTYLPSLWNRLVSVWTHGACRTVSPLAEK